MIKLILKNIRGSYVYINHQRKDDDNQDDGYGMQIIIPKDHPQLKQLEKSIAKAAHDKYPKIKLSMLKTPLRDGDEESDKPEHQECYFFNSSSNRKPGILNSAKTPATESELENLCFSGAYFHVSLTVKDFEHKGKKGVTTYLNNVMLYKDGDRLDGGTTADQDFADVEAEYDDDDLDDF